MLLAQDTGIISSAQCRRIDTLVLDEGVVFDCYGGVNLRKIEVYVTTIQVRGRVRWLQYGFVLVIYYKFCGCDL